MSEVRVELSLRELYLVSGVEGWHAKVGTAGAPEGVSQVAAATAAGEVFLGWFLATVQLLSEDTRAVLARLPLARGATHSDQSEASISEC